MERLKYWAVWAGLLLFNVPAALKGAKKVLEFIGLTTSPEDAMGLYEKLNEMPWWVALWMAFAAWATFFIYSALMTRRPFIASAGGEHHVDLGLMDEASAFSLWEAAWLWVDQNPRPQGHPMTPEARQVFLKLEAAVSRGDLVLIDRDKRSALAEKYRCKRDGGDFRASTNWVAPRWELVSCAHALGEKPKFLFPQERV